MHKWTTLTTLTKLADSYSTTWPKQRKQKGKKIIKKEESGGDGRAEGVERRDDQWSSALGPVQ